MAFPPQDTDRRARFFGERLRLLPNIPAVHEEWRKLLVTHGVSGVQVHDAREFVTDVRDLGVTPHVAQNHRNRRSAINARTTRHAGCEISQRKRKRVEEVFGWLKTVGLLRQTRYRGRERVGWMFTFATAVYNLVRIRNLTAEAV